MHNKIFKFFIVLTICILLFPFSTAFSAEDNINSTENKYIILIEDDADLLTDSQEKELRSILAGLSENGNVLFKTSNEVTSLGSLRFIQNYYYKTFGNNRGVAFYIDMQQRELCACASGGLDKTITSSKCNTIMDNVYRYASKGNYYQCAVETFSQMERLLNGQKIAQSMKYICNAILSVMISLFTVYVVFMIISKNRKSSQSELIKECETSFKHSPILVQLTGTHRTYSPRSSSSGSSGHSSGGGGGFSGSGGSHRF